MTPRGPHATSARRGDAAGAKAPRVIVADDHVATRAGVRMALERGGMEVCAEAASATEAVEAATRERPDACLLDVHMPGGGTAAASMITRRLPDTVVLMLTVSREHEDLLESLRRGADGYLLKDMDPHQLPAAVRSALRGEGIVPRALTARLVEEFRQGPPRRRLSRRSGGHADLTARESEILELLCEGLPTGEMADRLFLSSVTVRRHVSSLVRKLGATSREDAVRVALGDEVTSAR